MPTIGITLGYKNQYDKDISLQDEYIKAIRAAGGLPLLLPPHLEEEDIDQLKNMIDGILFTGGCDVDPVHFKKDPVYGLRRIDPWRDRFEINLLKWVLQEKIPFLALCRGIQILNIFCGGTINQHLEDGLKHEQEAPGSYPTHLVNLKEGGYLHQLLKKKEIAVNSFHHQAIAEPGENIKIEAEAADGVIEAVVLEGHPFAVGVQWHPERMIKEDPDQLKLFSELIRHSK